MPKRIIVFALAAVLFYCLSCFAQESMTITTYYPSPYGSYNELQLYPHSSPVTTCNSTTRGTMYYDSDDGITYVCDGTNYVQLGGGGWDVPSSIRVTTATNTGNFGGYRQMRTWIQSRGCGGYHVCDAVEITRYIQSGGAMPAGGGWYNGGLEATVPSLLLRDCSGWTSSSGSEGGSKWFLSPNQPSVDGCASANVVLCCK